MIAKIWKNNSILRQCVLVIIVGLHTLSLGFVTVWSSPVLVKLNDPNNLVLDRTITHTEGSWIILAAVLGCILAVLTLPYVADNFGRKACLVYSSIPAIIGYVILILANRVWMVILGRFVVALPCCYVWNVGIMYTSEIASTEIRGALGTICPTMVCLAHVIILCMGPFLTYFTLNVVLLAIIIIASMPLLCLPESPYFLYKKGKTEEALKVLTYFRDSKGQASHELKNYEQNIQKDKISFTEILTSKTTLKCMSIAVFFGLAGNVCGHPIILLYLQTILESTSSSIPSSVASLVIGIVELLSNFITFLVVEKFGRKPTISYTMSGVAIGMIGLGMFFTLLEAGYPVTGFMNYLPLASIILISVFFVSGMGSLMYPLLSELLEDRSRATGLSLCFMVSLITSFIMNISLVAVVDSIGVANLYWIFSITSISIAVFVFFCIPETKGKTFCEIQMALSGQ